MNSKLTLSLDEQAIATGKRVAARLGKSLSQLVEDYFVLLGNPSTRDEFYRISPGLQSLVGIGEGPFDETDYRTKRIERQS